MLHKIKELRKKKIFISFFLIIMLLFSVTMFYNMKKANAQEGSYTITQPDGTQIVYSWDNNELIQIYFDIITKEMVITGEHKTASNATIYRTNGFTITKGKAYKRVTAYTGGKTYIYKGQGMTEESNAEGETTFSTYRINSDTLMDSLVNDLGYSATQLKNGVTIYLSNIFRLGKRVNGYAYDISNYDYKNYSDDSTGKGIADAASWSQGALDSLKNYYDIQVNVKLIPNKYDIVYVDAKDESKILKTVATNKDIVIKEKYIHTPSETITVDGTKYNYAKKYKVEYENGKTSTNNNWPISSGPIKITHSFASNAVLKVFYEAEAAPEYDIIVSHINESGEEIAPDKNLGKKKAGTSFSYTSIKSPISYNKKSYTYAQKWDYSYFNKDGDIENDFEITTPNHPSFNKLPEVKSGFKLYLTLHYEEGSGGYEPPEGTPTPTPDPDNPPSPTPTPKPNVPPVVVPTPESVEETFTSALATGVIRADNRDAEKFTATQGVPTTESLYGEVLATEYLLGYRLTKKVGVKNYAIKVTKEYILEWEGEPVEEVPEGEEAEPVILTETVPVEQIVYLERAYGYWEIEWLDYYKIGNATLNNYALPNGSITLTPNYSYYSPPTITYSHSSSESDHIIDPSTVESGVILPPETIVGGKDKPTIPQEDFTWDAHIATEEIKVKSDYLSFNGSVVMANEIAEIEAPPISAGNMIQCTTTTNRNVLYKNNQIIEATKANGIYASSGILTYTRDAGVNSRYNSNIQHNIFGLNNVVIHTPVYCQASITGNNDSYVQLINPSNNVQLVLDPDHKLNDFSVSISNTGTHSAKLGYYYRDFSKSLRNPNISYIASSNGMLRNEVKFPFDAYLDIGNDMNKSNDTFVKANTWVVIGLSTPRVYIPMWVEEGIYTVEFRTVAVNGTTKTIFNEAIANTNLSNYVATDSVNVEVSGRLFGLTLYDVSDYPIWKEVFRVKDSTTLKRNTSASRGTSSTTYNKNYVYDYTVGTQDQYGNETTRNAKYIFPLVAGSHPYYKNVGILKSGYSVRFKLDAIGDYTNDLAYIKIKPLFYYVDSSGGNRIAVDLYYSEQIYGKTRNLVKIGSELDQVNLKSMKTGDSYLAIPKNQLETTAIMQGVTYSKWISQITSMFNFSSIKLKYPFRTFINTAYANSVLSSPQSSAITSAGISQSKMISRKQSFYGEYYIPANVHAVASGYDVMTYASNYGIDYKEDFWKKGGYIIVNFDIVAVDNNGNERLSYLNGSNYLNNGNCSMWVMEGAAPSKTDSKGVTFNFRAGDFIMFYTDKSAKDDYSVGGTH